MKLDDSGAFFKYHGVLAPGVRAFRRIGFPAKASWVSIAFLLPIVLLSWALTTAAWSSIQFSAQERLGVEYIRTLVGLLDAAQNRRRAATAKAADLDQVQGSVAKALDAVRAAQEKMGSVLRITDQWAKLNQLNQSLISNAIKEDASATFAAHTTFIDSVLELLNDVADNSNLTLDPDVDTFYLMDAAVFKQPLLIEQIGRIRGLGNAAIRAGSLPLDQREVIANALAFAVAHEAGVRKGLGRAVAAEPSLARAVHMDDAMAASQSFLALARTQLLGESPQGDAASFVAAANAAIKLHYEGVERMLGALDGRLASRVQRLKGELGVQLGLSAFGIAVAIYLLVAFYRVTQGGIAEVGRQLDEMSRGNLTMNPRPWGKDEVAQLMTTLATTLGALRRVVGQVRVGAGEIHTASTEVASASMDLSRRTEEAAAQLQRTSAAMVQIGSTVDHTAKTAEGATELTVRNAVVAQQGGTEVREVVATMGGIRSASARIEEIIGTIDSIAFQTNILSLNAAVEAARAGEQGRGFAVVASEVRALAQRSAGAAKEIKQLIGDSTATVDSGSRVVEQAGQTIQHVVENATKVKELIAEISDGTREQTTGLAEVSQSVERLDSMTQQNAALVEQTAAAAASLKDSAHQLNEAVAFFRV